MLRFYLLIFLALTPFSAHASTTGSVGSPGVTAGKTDIAVRLGYSEAEDSSSQDGRFRSRIQIDHGFTDSYAARLVVSQDKRKSDSYEHDSIAIDNRFDILGSEDYGFDFGVRAGYQHKDGDKKPSALTAGLFELVPLGDYELRFNQLFSHDVGEDANDGVDAEFRFQATRRLEGGVRVGVEGFHDFGNLTELSGYSVQSHQVGPVVKGTLFEHYKYEAGYRAGISENAPDHNVKLFISRSF